MAEPVRKFEELVAWQRARELTVAIYHASWAHEFRRDFGLASQIQRASVSIMANIAEGFERHRPAEFHQFLSVAKASCAEVRSHLYVALDIGYLTASDFDTISNLAAEVGRLVGGLGASVEAYRDRQSAGSELRTQNSELRPPRLRGAPR